MVNSGSILTNALLQTLMKPEMSLAEKFDYVNDYVKVGKRLMTSLVIGSIKVLIYASMLRLFLMHFSDYVNSFSIHLHLHFNNNKNALVLFLEYSTIFRF